MTDLAAVGMCSGTASSTAGEIERVGRSRTATASPPATRVDVAMASFRMDVVFALPVPCQGGRDQVSRGDRDNASGHTEAAAHNRSRSIEMLEIR